jgi:hypothetical protein
MIIRLVDAFVSRPLLLTRSYDPFTTLRRVLLIALLTLIGAAPAGAASVTLQWDPPIDGTTSGYVVWYGNAAGSYTSWTDVGFLTKYKIEGLAHDTYYCFSVRAYSASGETSDFSAAVCTRTPKSTTSEPPPPSDDPTTPPSETTDGKEIVLYATNIAKMNGNWAKVASTAAAGGYAMRSADRDWASADAPLASPTHYFQLRFDALANTPYRIWLRLRATSNSKWNDSVWVQFSNSLVGGRSAYRIGTTSGLLVNLERCNACGVSGWGWANAAYWLNQPTVLTFSQSGPQTVRIQTREDGVEIDQVVLSAQRFMSAAPGASTTDATILPLTVISVPATSTPYGSTPIALPGTVPAAHFDRGGAGVAYVDSTLGNAGGVKRATDVDLQPATVGGYNIAWTTAGEWVNYSVNVKESRSYTLKLKIASATGGSMQMTLGTASKTVSIPNTGGNQKWVTLNIPMTLSAGKQILTVKFVTANVNLRSIVVQ